MSNSNRIREVAVKPLTPIWTPRDSVDTARLFHLEMDNAERGHRYCVRCDKSQLVVRIDADGVCRYCKRRVRVSSMLFSRSRHRRAKVMDAVAVIMLMAFMAVFGALMFLHAGGPIG